jgi:hypothetical protein
VKEECEHRLELAPYYAEILTGLPRMGALSTVAEVRAAMLAGQSASSSFPLAGKVATRPSAG